MKLLALILTLSGFGIGTSLAADQVWVGLYLAENTPPPAQATIAPEKLHNSLQAVFGFKHYRLVKAQEIKLTDEWEQWAVPRKDLFIRVEPLPHQPGQPKIIDYEIYKDGFLIAHGQYEPHKDTPLFINGPDFKQGRFIFVLEGR